MVNHIMIECSKLEQNEYKTRNDWVGKVIYWELRKRSEFDYSPKWYILKLKSLLENKLYKILWDFEIQIDHSFPAKKSNCVLINKRKITSHLMDFTIPVDHSVKMKENEKIDKYLDLARELKRCRTCR